MSNYVGIGENMQYKRFPLWEKGCLAAIMILILAALPLECVQETEAILRSPMHYVPGK